MRYIDGVVSSRRLTKAVTKKAREHPIQFLGAMVLALLAVVFLLWINLSTEPTAGSGDQLTIPTRPLVAATPVGRPAPGKPVLLSSSAINLSASVEEVGLTKKGAMAVPTNTADAGWFNLGYRPGEVGNAVITGHLDTIWLRPAVFANINKLKIGDEITVTDQNNHAFVFKVRQISHYKVKELPLTSLFGPAPVPQLNLITCSGQWSWKIATYTERTVVYTSLE